MSGSVGNSHKVAADHARLVRDAKYQMDRAAVEDFIGRNDTEHLRRYANELGLAPVGDHTKMTRRVGKRLTNTGYRVYTNSSGQTSLTRGIELDAGGSSPRMTRWGNQFGSGFRPAEGDHRGHTVWQELERQFAGNGVGAPVIAEVLSRHYINAERANTLGRPDLAHTLDVSPQQIRQEIDALQEQLRANESPLAAAQGLGGQSQGGESRGRSRSGSSSGGSSGSGSSSGSSSQGMRNRSRSRSNSRERSDYRNRIDDRRERIDNMANSSGASYSTGGSGTRSRSNSGSRSNAGTGGPGMWQQEDSQVSQALGGLNAALAGHIIKQYAQQQGISDADAAQQIIQQASKGNTASILAMGNNLGGQQGGFGMSGQQGGLSGGMGMSGGFGGQGASRSGRSRSGSRSDDPITSQMYPANAQLQDIAGYDIWRNQMGSGYIRSDRDRRGKTGMSGFGGQQSGMGMSGGFGGQQGGLSGGFGGNNAGNNAGNNNLGGNNAGNNGGFGNNTGNAGGFGANAGPSNFGASNNNLSASSLNNAGYNAGNLGM